MQFCKKKVDILALSVLHNYFNNLTKSFSDMYVAKFLNISVKPSATILSANCQIRNYILKTNSTVSVRNTRTNYILCAKNTESVSKINLTKANISYTTSYVI